MSLSWTCSQLFCHWASQNLWVNISDYRPPSACRRVWILFVRIRIGPGEIREVCRQPSQWFLIWWHVMNLLSPLSHRVILIDTSHFRPRLTGHFSPEELFDPPRQIKVFPLFVREERKSWVKMKSTNKQRLRLFSFLFAFLNEFITFTVTAPGILLCACVITLLSPHTFVSVLKSLKSFQMD